MASVYLAEPPRPKLRAVFIRAAKLSGEHEWGGRGGKESVGDLREQGQGWAPRRASWILV